MDDLNCFVQCSSHHVASATNPLGMGYRIQLAGDFGPIVDHLGDRVAGRRVIWHLPFGYPAAGIMPFDAWFLARKLWPGFADTMELSFILGCQTLRNRGATEVIAYLGSLPSCRRVTDNFGKPGRADDPLRIVKACTRVAEQAGCSIAYDATAEVQEPWIVQYLQMQDAILRKWGLRLYTEATSSRQAPLFDRFPSFVLDTVFDARHVTGSVAGFPRVTDPDWYKQQVNVLTSDTPFRTKTTEFTVSKISGWQTHAAVFANVGLFDRLIPQ